MPTKAVYKGKSPEIEDFGLENESKVSFTMAHGAVSTVVYNTNFRKEFLAIHKPKLEKGYYSFSIEKTTAVIDPLNPPVVTITF